MVMEPVRAPEMVTALAPVMEQATASQMARWATSIRLRTRKQAAQ